MRTGWASRTRPRSLCPQERRGVWPPASLDLVLACGTGGSLGRRGLEHLDHGGRVLLELLESILRLLELGLQLLEQLIVVLLRLGGGGLHVRKLLVTLVRRHGD